MFVSLFVFVVMCVCVCVFVSVCSCFCVCMKFWSRTLMELILTRLVNFGEVRRAQSAKSTLLTSKQVSWDLFRCFKVCSDPKREWGAESNGKLPHLFIPNKTATLVPEFAVEDLPLGRTVHLVPEFAVKNLPSGRTFWWWWWWWCLRMMMLLRLLVTLQLWNESYSTEWFI